MDIISDPHNAFNSKGTVYSSLTIGGLGALSSDPQICLAEPTASRKLRIMRLNWRAPPIPSYRADGIAEHHTPRERSGSRAKIFSLANCFELDTHVLVPKKRECNMTSEDQDLVLTRILDAPRDKLWRCWTEPELLKKWFCPKPWFVSDARIDLRPGGEFYTLMNGPNGEKFGEPGVFLDVAEQKRLVFTDAFRPGWRPAGKPFMAAEVLFEDAADGKTRYTARAMHWSADARKQHEEMGFRDGWGKAADQLEALAKTL